MENENENVNANVKAKKSSKGLIIGIVAAIAVIVIGVVAWMYFAPSTSGSYVAKVDSLEISESEYRIFTKYNMDQFLASLNNADSSKDSAKTADEYKWDTKSNGETAKDQVKKTTLDNLQEVKIQLIKAKEAGIKLETADLESVDQAIQQRITQSGSNAAAEEAIKKDYGVTLAQYKEFYKDLMLTQKYIDSERAKISVTDDEAKKYFEDNKNSYDKVTVAHILIAAASTDSEGKKAEAKKKAEDLLKQVQAGADIKELAVKFSDDKASVNENKGVYTFAKGEMVTEFENWAFDKHEAGDAGIVQTTYGYHVMQYQKRETAKFEDKKEDIKNSLIYTKFGEDFTKRMEAWKKEAKFEVKKNDSSMDKVDKSLYHI